MPALLPALFAYLLGLGLLLGGGYGALSWLAAPEPVKVVAKAKPKPASANTASIPEPNSPERSQPQAVEAARAKPASSDKPKSDKPQSNEPGARLAAREQGTQSNQSEQAADQQAASAEATRSSRAEAAPEATRLAPHREPGPVAGESTQEHKQQQNKQPAEAAPSPTTSVAAAKPKRPHSRQASRPSEKRALTLMTLRTIEFPDGRRVTQLIPYHDNRRAMAFDPDW